jgi:hypothetical protein
VHDHVGAAAEQPAGGGIADVAHDPLGRGELGRPEVERSDDVALEQEPPA